MYVELKTGFNDDGPRGSAGSAFSKTGQTLYYRNRCLQSLKGGGGMFANYVNIDTGDECWVSGVKKNRQDRHWAGHGPVDIDEDAAEEYRRLVGL